MKKIFVIVVMLILLVTALPLVNAITINNEVLDESKIEFKEDIQLHAGKMSIHPGTFWNGYSPDVDVDVNKNFGGKRNIERSSTITITADWEIEEDTATFWDENWLFIMDIKVRQYEWIYDKFIWCFLDCDRYEREDNEGSSDKGSGTLTYTLPKLDPTQNWFQDGGIVELKVELRAYYLRWNYDDRWDDTDITDVLKLEIIGNSPPDKPQKPDGPVKISFNDDKVRYESKTIDPDGDKIKYGWDFNGDKLVDYWTGFKDSGTSTSVKPKWTLGETTYTIRVKAVDELYGDESEWSDPLSVVVPRSKTTIFQDILTRIFGLL